jgi:hypothetical protein
MKELTGLPPDPNCLHCHLAPIIQTWEDAHPNVERQKVLVQFAQVLGELIASSAPDAGCIPRLVRGLMGTVERRAQDTFREAARKAPPS